MSPWRLKLSLSVLHKNIRNCLYWSVSKFMVNVFKFMVNLCSIPSDMVETPSKSSETCGHQVFSFEIYTVQTCWYVSHTGHNGRSSHCFQAAVWVGRSNQVEGDQSVSQFKTLIMINKIIFKWMTLIVSGYVQRILQNDQRARLRHVSYMTPCCIFFTTRCQIIQRASLWIL